MCMLHRDKPVIMNLKKIHRLMNKYGLVCPIRKANPYRKMAKSIKTNHIVEDSEIITISIVGESLSIDSERAWVSYVNKNLKDLFPKMCERSRFNRTRRNLLSVIEEISKQVTYSHHLR